MSASQKSAIRLVAALMMLVCASAMAADTGLNGFGFHIFQPTTDGIGLTTVAGSEVLKHKQWNVGMTESFEQNLIKAIVPASATSVQLIRSRALQDVQAAVGLWNRFDVGIGFPVALYQSGTDFSNLAPYKNAALGDVRMDIKWRAMKDKRRRLGVALLSRATFPTGNRMDFMGDDGPTWEGRLIVDKNFKWFGLYANGGYRVAKNVRVLSTTVGNRVTFSGGVRARLPIQQRSWALYSEVAGESNLTNRSSLTTPVELRGGIEKNFKSGIAIQLGGGHGLTDAFGSPSYRVYASIRFTSKKASEAVQKTTQPEPIPMSIYFKFNRARIQRQDKGQLEMVASVLRQSPDRVVWIRGYTDSIGPRAYNKRLSQRRAWAVQMYLEQQGVTPTQIKSAGLGETHPVYDNTTPKGRSQNRRVDIGDTQ